MHRRLLSKLPPTRRAATEPQNCDLRLRTKNVVGRVTQPPVQHGFHRDLSFQSLGNKIINHEVLANSMNNI